MIFLRLFWEFFKTGLFAVGGGMATLPFLYSMSERTGWFSQAQLADMVAVSESTPGPIGVNMAIARVLDKFRKNRFVDAAFYGLRPCSLALIAAAGLLVVKITLFHAGTFEESGLMGLFNWKAIALAAVLLLFTRGVKRVKKLHPIVFILASAVVGAVFSF